MYPQTPSFQLQSPHPSQFTLPASPFVQSHPIISPKNNPSLHFGLDLLHQGKRVIGPTSVGQDDPYCCKFIGQLQGSYEIDSSSGVDLVSVIVPEVTNIMRPYAIVRRVCDDGEALPDQFIFDEQSRFTLRTAKDDVVAIMRKGRSMRYNIIWESKDGFETV